ncbi:NAD(P)H-binding protein [Streptomyces kanamyceticus]|uniref:SDR family NAD(P)-dependent oxidoreductase n=1 Tax=Streptomyces kanamyceticus TaxID=1967 RepID=A0A5J6G9M5_STRKN|nr:NAD(P)H-binding protein [Streptomyces kanamyceticus]QEU92500.1 SDR family NAD(P)-dependent oxidoreductase [Streptomyces kanamyceticus]
MTETEQQTTQSTQTAESTDPILVLGATGKTGRHVVARLRAAGHAVRAASRTSGTRFDWTDRATWAPALAGVRALYLVVPTEAEPIADFIAQAKAAGVRRFVVLSGRGVELYGHSFEPGMAEAEQAVRDADVDWTVIRPNNFAQNFDEDLFHGPLLAGRLALPTGDVPEPFIDVTDIAEVAAALLTEEGHTHRVYELTGPRALSFGDAVAEIAAASGRPMRFEHVTEEQYVAELVADGVPDEAARSLAHVFVFLSEGHNATPTSGVRDVLGREPRDFSEYVQERAKAGAWAPR